MDLERFLIWRCAPVLAGVKSANLVSVSKFSFPNAQEQLERISKESCPLKFALVCSCVQRILVFVYREDLLENALCAADAALWLEQYGYVKQMSLDEKVAHIVERLERESSCSSCEKGNVVFPHEVGVFLGYPLEDVKGFVAHGGQGAKISGYWKVYGDEERARKVFSLYEKCFAKSLEIAERGASFSEACTLLSA